VDRRALRPGDRELPREEWLAVEAEILVPAALSYVLTEANVDEVRARLVVEAANVPTTAGGEVALTARGIPVIPDFVANVATNAWWWWTLFGDIAPTAEASFAKISTTLRGLLNEMLDRVARTGGSPRAAAQAMANERAAELPR
jgi:glutamate dehydrogenase (NAD(P)+)